jgi:diacylglycerol kinase (ATP)
LIHGEERHPMPSPKHIRILVNPSARSGRGRRAVRQARALADRLPGLHPEWAESRSADHLRELVRAAQGDALDAVAVAGGDGTVALALDALAAGHRLPLGVLPVGSGNDFAHDLGIGDSPADWLAVLAGGAARPVDVARSTPGGPRFCCVLSVGLDELALRYIHGSWLPRSKMLNILSALRALWSYRPRAVRVEWDNGSFEGEIMFAAVTNTRSYGGGFRVSPAARLDDGLLDLCLFRRTGRARLLWHFPRVLSGTHGSLPEVIQATSPWFRISGIDGELPVALDGELPRLTTPVEPRCEPAAVEVLAPVVSPLPAPRRAEPCHA